MRRLSVLSVTRSELAKKFDGVRDNRDRGARMHVRGGTHLKWDATVANEVGQSAEMVVAVLFDDVVGDAHPVPSRSALQN